MSSAACAHVLIFSGGFVEVLMQPRQQLTMIMVESVALSYSWLGALMSLLKHETPAPARPIAWDPWTLAWAGWLPTRSHVYRETCFSACPGCTKQPRRTGGPGQTPCASGADTVYGSYLLPQAAFFSGGIFKPELQPLSDCRLHVCAHGKTSPTPLPFICFSIPALTLLTQISLQTQDPCLRACV